MNCRKCNYELTIEEIEMGKQVISYGKVKTVEIDCPECGNSIKI